MGRVGGSLRAGGCSSICRETERRRATHLDWNAVSTLSSAYARGAACLSPSPPLSVGVAGEGRKYRGTGEIRGYGQNDTESRGGEKPKRSLRSSPFPLLFVTLPELAHYSTGHLRPVIGVRPDVAALSARLMGVLFAVDSRSKGPGPTPARRSNGG